MKPFELVAALMHEQQLKTLTLAKRMGKQGLQSQLHRFLAGDVPQPEHSTAAPIAKFFNIPLDAIYEEGAATRIAKERNLSVVDWPPRAARKTAKATASKAPGRKAMAIAEAYESADADGRRKILEGLAKMGIKFPDEMPIADTRHDFGVDAGESNLGPLDQIKKPKRKDQP